MHRNKMCIRDSFKAKTDELFHEISEMNPAEIEETVKVHVQAKIDEYGIDAQIVDAAVVGSRCRGLEREGSDLDVVVELSTNEREDDLFNTFNEDGLHIGGIKVDINPITEQRTGSLETYLPQVEEYLEGIRMAREQAEKEVEVTLMVSELSLIHIYGRNREIAGKELIELAWMIIFPLFLLLRMLPFRQTYIVFFQLSSKPVR